MKSLPHFPLLSACSPVFAIRWQALRPPRKICVPLVGLVLTVTPSIQLLGQEPQPAPTAPTIAPAPAQTPVTPHPAPPAAAPVSALQEPTHTGEVTEDELKQLLVGKQLFLRGGYLGDSLSFSEQGDPIGHPAVGSYTLSGVEIEKVRLTKRKVDLEGARYALHFLGALPYEDSSKAVDRVKITPKKKVLRISIEREQVVKPKKTKEPKEKKADGKPIKTGETPKDLVASSETDVATPTPASAPDHTADQVTNQVTNQVTTQATDQAGFAIVSPAHASRALREALGRIFAEGLDVKTMAQMPQFWQLYYQAQAAGVDYRPSDPSVLRSSAVDQQAKVLSSIAPDSNEFAQANGIAGRALYRAVIGTDGKPGEIAVVRPIGFGLDENAVAAIRKAAFQPALKGGQPVPEALDLAVLFRIYSKRTSGSASEIKPAEPVKPGPYSVKEP
jgi:TonB family protein